MFLMFIAIILKYEIKIKTLLLHDMYFSNT